MEERVRQYYEVRLGKPRVADSHWWKIKKILSDANLELTENNIDRYLELKKYCPRYTSNLSLISSKLKAFTEYVRGSEKVSGKYFYHYLILQNINPTQPTFSRWFKPVGGYRKDRLYTIKDLTIVAMSAFIYQIKKEVSTNG